MERIENIKRPVKKGERYLVPCIVRRESMNDYYISKGGEQRDVNVKMFITPVINHPHTE